MWSPPSQSTRQIASPERAARVQPQFTEGGVVAERRVVEMELFPRLEERYRGLTAVVVVAVIVVEVVMVAVVVVAVVVVAVVVVAVAVVAVGVGVVVGGAPAGVGAVVEEYIT